MANPLSATLRITSAYVIFAGAWILFSDMAVEAMVPNAEAITLLQTIKGWFFVIVTGLLLFILVLRNYQKLEQVFQLDGLTGLLNHHMFKIQLDRRIATLQAGQKIVLGYLDINRFNEINQSVGIDRADQFLIQLAREFEDFARANSIIGRLPPDQFAIAREYDGQEDIDSRVREYQVLYRQVAKKMNVNATCSIGVAIYPDDGDTAKTLMAAAADALAIAKRNGIGVQYHDRSMSEQATKRRELLEDLKTAIATEAFSLVYQPKYVINTGRASGLEVLIRWHHATRGFISPVDFIPLAEEQGLSHAITLFVLKRAAQELGASGLLREPIQHVSINVSAAEFNEALEMESLQQSIRQYPVLAPLLRVEITETATLHDMQQSAAIINQLRSQGLGVSVDDFGTGYTSLAMLKDFTIDEIKIDRSFVSEMETGGRSRTIVEAIIAMANSFDINVVAEGVETEAQLQQLAAMGCKEAQGFYLGKPMAIEALKKHLSE